MAWNGNSECRAEARLYPTPDQTRREEEVSEEGVKQFWIGRGGLMGAMRAGRRVKLDVWRYGFVVLLVLVGAMCLCAERAEGRIKVGDVSDVVDDEEDEDWDSWGKFSEKKPQNPGLSMDDLQSGKLDMAEVAASQNRQGPVMVFVHLFRDKIKSKKDTEDTLSRWKEMLMVGGVSTNPYPIQEDTVLITIEKGGRDFKALKDFLLDQDLVEELEIDGQKVRRPGQPPRVSAEDSRGEL